MYRKLRVLLRYTAGTGLINQHYSHIAAFALASVLGAEVVLPPAMHRSSFQHIFSVSEPRLFRYAAAYGAIVSMTDIELACKYASSMVDIKLRWHPPFSAHPGSCTLYPHPLPALRRC